jgi:hypothetical protein
MTIKVVIADDQALVRGGFVVMVGAALHADLPTQEQLILITSLLVKTEPAYGLMSRLALGRNHLIR